LAKSLAPLYGEFAKYLLSLGLFSAGITSAITAPLAAAYVAKGCFGWSGNLKSKKFRWVWFLILFLGVFFSSVGLKPIEIIKFAQVANGLLLPIITAILLWIMNRKSVLGKFTNTTLQNVFGGIILLVSLFLGLKSIFKVFNIF
jgi:manganese transport protein